jgi:hypothetical protein
MGSRGGFDNGMAGGCTPVRGVDAFDVKIKLRADPSLLPMHARTISRGGDTSVCLSQARAPIPRDTVAVRDSNSPQDSFLSFLGY